MQAAIDQFHASMDRVRDLHALHNYFHANTTVALDISDLLRAQIVLCVSALDYYVHELTRMGMIEIFEAKRPQTAAFLRFPVTVDGVTLAMQPGAGSGWLDTAVRSRHSILSFQQPDNIADAIRLFSEVRLWDEVGSRLGMPAKEIKDRLRLIVQRRNQIAHEADLDPSYPGVRWPISPADVTSATDFVTQVCEAIHQVVS